MAEVSYYINENIGIGALAPIAVPSDYIDENIGIEVLAPIAVPSASVAQNAGIEVLMPDTPSDYVAQNAGLEHLVGTQLSLVLVQNPGDYAADSVNDQLGPEFAFAPRVDRLIPSCGRFGNAVAFEGLGFGDECVFLRFGQYDAYGVDGNWVLGTSHAYGVFTATQSTWTAEIWFRSQRQGPYEDPAGESTGSLVELCTIGAPIITRYILELDQGHVRAKAGATILTTLDHYDDGDWHSARMVYAGSSLSLLVDGVPISSAAVTNHAIDYVRVGGIASYVEADVREFQIVQANLGTSNYAPAWEYVPNLSTVGLWHFNDGAGATVADFSGNDSDLVLEGDDYNWTDWDFELEVLLNELVCGGPTGVRNRRGIFTVPADAESGQVYVWHTRVHEDVSNSRTFTVLAEEPLRGIGVEIRIYDRNNFGTLLAILENAYGIGISLELDGAGAGAFSLHASDPKATDVNLAHGNLVRVYYDGIERCAFLIEQVDEVVLGEGEESVQTLAITGRGPFALLEGAIVYPPDWPIRDPLLTSYVDKTPGYILADQITKAVARGALLSMTADFTDTVDSNGELWPETFTMDVEPGITVMSLLDQFVTMGYNAYVTSGIKLKVYVSRGIDRTLGQAPTVFRQGYNLYSKTRKSSSASVKTIALVAADTGLSEFATGSSFPRRETFMNATNQDISTAGRAAALALALLSEASEGFDSVVESIYDVSEVFEDFDIGDWVYVDIPGKYDMERFRVRAITMTVEDEGTVTWTVAFNSLYYEWSIRVKRLIDGLSAGSASGSTGSGALNPINPTTGVVIPGKQQFVFGVRIITDDEEAFVVAASDLTEVLVVDTVAKTVALKKLAQIDDEDPNTVFAGPATAPAAPPGYRVLVADDLPVEAVVDSDIAPDEGFLRKTGAGTYTALKSNLDSNADPGVNDDADAGYSVGSVWINITLDKVWQCVDSTNDAAVWKDLGGSAHAEVTLGEGSDPALELDGQELTLADVLTPDEHDDIGDDSPHHPAITLDVGCDPALELAEGQVLNLTLPAAIAPTLAAVMIGRGQWGEITPRQASNSAILIGLYDGATATGTVLIGEDADGIYDKMSSGATSGNEGGWAAGYPVHARRHNSIFIVKLKLVSTALVRGFWGLIDKTLANSCGSDDPAGSYIGLQYSSPRADANWQFVCKDNVTQNIHDTGIAVSTNAVYARFTLNDSVPNILAELLDSNYAVVATYTFIANLPATATGLWPVVGVETQTAALKAWQMYFVRGVNPNV